MPHPTSGDQALDLLRTLGASGWLLRHHELVIEAGEALLRGIAPLDPAERTRVLLGCALHDRGEPPVAEGCGKLRAPERLMRSMS